MVISEFDEIPTIKVTDPNGHKATFKDWRGALAHAIFIHTSSLDYFHTHVCAPGAALLHQRPGRHTHHRNSRHPGQLTVGILLPAPGTWRMFLLTHINNTYLTARDTLTANP